MCERACVRWSFGGRGRVHLPASLRACVVSLCMGEWPRASRFCETSCREARRNTAPSLKTNSGQYVCVTHVVNDFLCPVSLSLACRSEPRLTWRLCGGA